MIKLNIVRFFFTSLHILLLVGVLYAPRNVSIGGAVASSSMRGPPQLYDSRTRTHPQSNKVIGGSVSVRISHMNDGGGVMKIMFGVWQTL
jgi:hypothetical protein